MTISIPATVIHLLWVQISKYRKDEFGNQWSLDIFYSGNAGKWGRPYSLSRDKNGLIKAGREFSIENNLQIFIEHDDTP